MTLLIDYADRNLNRRSLRGPKTALLATPNGAKVIHLAKDCQSYIIGFDRVYIRSIELIGRSELCVHLLDGSVACVGGDWIIDLWSPTGEEIGSLRRTDFFNVCSGRSVSWSALP